MVLVGLALAIGAGVGGCGDEECDALAPAEPTELELQVVNHRSETIYLDTSCGLAIFLERLDGEANVYLDTCTAPSCEAALAGDCNTACPLCAGALLPIAPGATHVRRWSRTVFERADLGSKCTDACAEECVQEITAPPGAYRAFASLFGQCPLPEGCACPPGTGEPCLVPYDSAPLPDENLQAEFSLPRDGAVQIAVE
jgi:hypothetical protein